MSEYRFHFSLARLLVLTALVGLWLASLAVLPLVWIVWLAAAEFYLGVLLCFAPDTGPGDSAGDDGAARR